MSFKPGYFCGFCQTEARALNNLKICGSCQIATYCHDDCKNQDWKKHKTICYKIAYLNVLIPKIEKNFYDFDLQEIDDDIPPAMRAQIKAAMKEMARTQVCINQNIKTRKILDLRNASPLYMSFLVVSKLSQHSRLRPFLIKLKAPETKTTQG